MLVDAVSFDSELMVLTVNPLAQAIACGARLEDQYGNSYVLAQDAAAAGTALTVATVELAGARAVKRVVSRVYTEDVTCLGDTYRRDVIHQVDL